MNKAQRRAAKQIEWAKKNYNTEAAKQLFDKYHHDYDDDGVCTKCGFDGAEYHHWRFNIPERSRPEISMHAKYCASSI